MRALIQWLMVLALVGLAACDTLSTLAPPISAVGLGLPNTESATAGPSAPGPTRALALMPANRSAEGPTPPAIVVHGRGAPPSAAPAQPIVGTTPGGEVTLNFAGADIRDVINSVLGETLKLNYVVDPEVKGPVNFNVSRPLTRDEVLPTLEAVLNSRGDTMVRTDGIIRVMPMQKAGKPSAVVPIGRGAGGPTAIGERSEVFPLRFVGAADMQHLLEKVLPPGQVIVADEPHHLLLVQGSQNDLEVAEQTIRIFDIDQLSGMSMALVPLRNAEPEAVATELRNIFNATNKDTDANAIRVMSIQRLNAVMVLTRSPRYLDEAREWIARLDRAHDMNERKVYVYNLQYAKAVDVAQKLQGLLSGLDIQFKGPGTAAAEGLGAAGAEAKPDASGKPAGPGDAAPRPIAAPVAAPPAADSAATPANPASDKAVRIEADEAHNALLISSTGRDYDLIRQVLEGIDVPPLQVLIEVTVAEVELNNTLNYGVQYFLNSGKGQALLTTGTTAAGITPTVPGFALSLASLNGSPRIILDALSELTQTKVISTPRLLVLSNQTARLQVGDVVPIITQSATSTQTSNPLIVNNVQYKETGVVLEVTPRVNAGGYVTMDINQSVSNVVNTTTSTIDSPTIQQRRLTSTISVKSGQSILLGGLIQQSDNRDSAGIPFLHDLPGIGPLFGNHNNSTARTELIMFMTPHVISNDQDASDITRRVQHEFQAVLDASTMAPIRPAPR